MPVIDGIEASSIDSRQSITFLHPTIISIVLKIYKPATLKIVKLLRMNPCCWLETKLFFDIVYGNMESTVYSPFIKALGETFGNRTWTPAEIKDKAKTKNEVAALLNKAKSKILVGDLKKVIYDLWEAGVVELVPPKGRERNYRVRLTSNPTSSGSTTDNETIEKAYRELKSETKMLYVYFNEIAKRSGQPLNAVHEWAHSRAKAGQAELSEGDFSLAMPEQREGCYQLKGRKFLLVGVFN